MSKTAGLPPGTYRFYVTAQATTPGALSGSPIYSNYSAPITINAAPQAQIMTVGLLGELLNSSFFGRNVGVLVFDILAELENMLCEHLHIGMRFNCFRLLSFEFFFDRGLLLEQPRTIC